MATALRGANLYVGELSTRTNSEHRVSPSLLRPVHNCACKVQKIIAPAGFPVNVIGIACFLCGFVYEYRDLVSPFDVPRTVQCGSSKEMPSRAWVVRGGLAIQPDRFDKEENEIEWRLREGQHYADISATMKIPEAYVRAVAKLLHLDRETLERERAAMISRKGRPPKVGWEKHAAVIAQVRNGLEIAAIAKKFRVPQPYVYRISQRYGPKAVN